MNANLSPADMVTVLYDLAIAAEKRRIRQIRWRIFKSLILLIIVASILFYPGFIMGKITDMLKPIIISTASGLIENQKSELKNSLKDLLPSGIDLQ